MKFVLTEKVKKYLEKKSIDSLVIDTVELKNCWIAPSLPSVLAGKPNKNQEKFDIHEVDGVKLYVNRNIPFNNESISIKIRRFFLVYELYVDAVDLMH